MIMISGNSALSSPRDPPGVELLPWGWISEISDFTEKLQQGETEGSCQILMIWPRISLSIVRRPTLLRHRDVIPSEKEPGLK